MTRPGNNRVAPGAERGKKKKKKTVNGRAYGSKVHHTLYKRETHVRSPCVSFSPSLFTIRAYIHVRAIRASVHNTFVRGRGRLYGIWLANIYRIFEYGRATISRDNLTLARSCERSRGVFCSITRNRGSNLCSTLYMGRERGGPITRRRRLRKRRVFDN